MSPSHEPEPRSDALVTRSEEELRVSFRRRAVQRARLVRDVESETVTRTVTVHHDRVHVEYLPVANGPEAVSDRPHEPASPNDQWMVLYDEEVVVTTRRVPRERVRLRVRSVTEEREVSETVRRERIAIDTPDSIHG